MPPLVRGEVDRPVVFVADIAVAEPAVQHGAVSGGSERPLAGGVGCGAWKQVLAAVGPASQHQILLGSTVRFISDQRRC